MNVYARDSLAPALRELDRMIAEVRAGNFRPDASRSGLLLGRHEASDDEYAPTELADDDAD
eukprot:2479384-Amphidinium_carterae.1